MTELKLESVVVVLGDDKRSLLEVEVGDEARGIAVGVDVDGGLGLAVELGTDCLGCDTRRVD